MKHLCFLILSTLGLTCTAQPAGTAKSVSAPEISHSFRPANIQISEYLPLLQSKNVGLVVNQTSVINNVHLVDTLLKSGVSIKRIFAPEHGFRGTADAGEELSDNKDMITGLPVVSLYGKKYKPDTSDFENIDVMVFDIQDVGVRFYTYISTLHYVMEACAEQNVPLVVLDRPNPNGWYIDGFVLQDSFRSFVGVDPLPIVYGMTIGEVALMINGERWLADSLSCALTVIKCDTYDRSKSYELPIAPSPNLKTWRSVYLYPSLCFFEGTDLSIGRGTAFPFQLLGHPAYKGVKTTTINFTPKSMAGAANPPQKDVQCFGWTLLKNDTQFHDVPGEINWNYLLHAYKYFPYKQSFWLKNNFTDKLAGSQQLRKMVTNGRSASDIHLTYRANIADFKEKRKKYLLYLDFN